MSVSIEEFIERLCVLKMRELVSHNVLEFLADNPLEPETLQPFLHFSEKFYTRNLIYKDETFEIMTLCWFPGQISQIHDHSNQNCWMSVPIGSLTIENFRAIEHDMSRRYCQLIAADTFQLSPEHPAQVDRDEPIHRVSNRSNERSVSLHIYSKPIERCNIFSLSEHSFAQTELSYTSAFGKLCDGIEL